MSFPRNVNEGSSSSIHFENLPDVILFKIFSYLYIGDLCRAGRVCLRWYHLSRCHILWKRVDAHDMQLTSHQVRKLIPVLPSCVAYLRICSLSTQQRIPFLSPHTAIEIRERCPHLKTLIIESAFIAKHINFTDITVEDLPQRLSVLSLRKSFFHTDQFFCSVSHPTVPKIKVLDCSWCWCVSDNDIPFFSRLSDLQELYLAGCPITNDGVETLLKSVENLRVLDLEATGIGTQTMLTLSQYCPSLEKLYLGYTHVTDEYLCSMQSSSFPSLQTICLRNTEVGDVGLHSLASSLRTLKYIDISTPSFASECSLEFTVNLQLKVRYFYEDLHSDNCDHFFLRSNQADY